MIRGLPDEGRVGWDGLQPSDRSGLGYDLWFPAVRRKKVTPFDAARLTSDGGAMLLAAGERRRGIAGRPAGFDRRSARAQETGQAP